VPDQSTWANITAAVTFLDVFLQVNAVGAFLDAFTDDTIKSLHDKNIADDTLNAVGIATGVACVALSIAYTAMTFVPGSGA
jgi:hypothetical protein